MRVVTDNTPATRQRSRALYILLGAVLVGAVLALGIFLGGKQTPGVAQPPPESMPVNGTPSGATEPTGKPTASPESSKPPHMNTLGEVIPGLWQGTATVTIGNNNALYGVPIGWNRTIDGAIGAAMNYDASSYALAQLVDDTATAIASKIYVASSPAMEANTAEIRAEIREVSRLDDEGGVVDANGNPSQAERYYGGGAPQYGAYRVDAVDAEAQGEPTQVTVSVVQPVWSGPGTDTNLEEVMLQYRTVQYVMVWDEDDWKISDFPASDSWDANRISNQGFPHLVSLVGPGWAIPADGTQEALPGMVLTQ